MRVACFLILCLALMGGCMAGGLGSNVTREQQETARAALVRDWMAPSGVDAQSDAGNVTVNMGDDAVKAQLATHKTTLNSDAQEDFFGKNKNPFTLILMAAGILALFLVIVYVARKTGLDKAAKKARTAIDDALQRATTDKEMLELERAKSALDK